MGIEYNIQRQFLGADILDRRASILTILIILTIIMSGCEMDDAMASDTIIHKDLNGVDIKKLNHYNIEVHLDYDNHSYNGKQTLTYVNNTEKIIYICKGLLSIITMIIII